MKKLTILTMVVAIFATLSLSAADGDAKPKRERAKPTKEQLEKYDKNKDGKIDKNDNLSKEEMKAYRDEVRKARESAPAK